MRTGYGALLVRGRHWRAAARKLTRSAKSRMRAVTGTGAISYGGDDRQTTGTRARDR
ncbi:hypothetical protein GCM10023335_21900 [Streptomyces siamensis]|uniref:Uncharacterized protein n=1 Tax=Streptomyces siamensis TaxID=1274986 RepID=A0ABP9IPF4_9ACTN